MSTVIRDIEDGISAPDGEAAPRLVGLLKTPTGISGLDEVTGGGLPKGRSTLLCGPAGCGKTLIAMEFLVRGHHRVQRVWRVRGVRGDDRRPEVERCIVGLRPGKARGRWPLDAGSRQPGARRHAETGDWDLDGLFSAWVLRSMRWYKESCYRHDRGPIRGILQYLDTSPRAGAVVRISQRTRRNCGDHRRAR